MKLLDIIKTVGSVAISNLIPGGSLIVDAVNEFLPDDKKLPADPTGDQINNAIKILPADKQADLLSREFDVQVKKLDTLQVMLQANEQSKQTTRPKIAYQSFLVIAFSTITIVTTYAIAVVTSDEEMVAAIENSWLFILGVIGPLVTVLHAYFGVLTEESKDRFNAAQGHKVEPLKGLLSKLLNR